MSDTFPFSSDFPLGTIWSAARISANDSHLIKLLAKSAFCVILSSGGSPFGVHVKNAFGAGHHRHRKIMRQKHALISMRQFPCASVAEWKIMQFTFMASNNKSLFHSAFSLKIHCKHFTTFSPPSRTEKSFCEVFVFLLFCLLTKGDTSEINFISHAACAYNLH